MTPLDPGTSSIQAQKRKYWNRKELVKITWYISRVTKSLPISLSRLFLVKGLESSRSYLSHGSLSTLQKCPLPRHSRSQLTPLTIEVRQEEAKVRGIVNIMRKIGDNEKDQMLHALDQVFFITLEANKTTDTKHTQTVRQR